MTSATSLTSASISAHEPTQPLLTIKQVAARVGVSVRTFESWYASGRVPQFIRCGPRLRRWSQSVIDRWIDQRCPTRRIFEAREAAKNEGGCS